jgi:parallel beta-helix repeat protein
MGIRSGLLVVLLTLASALAACGDGPPTQEREQSSSSALVGSLQTLRPMDGTCINGGSQVDINAALQTGDAVLCPGSVFYLTAPVVFTKAGTKLYTQWVGSNPPQAKLIIVNWSLATAIDGRNVSDIVISNIVVDGNRGNIGHCDQNYGCIDPNNALIEIGGNASGQTVWDIKAGNTRSWSTLHINTGDIINGAIPTCQHATITNNTIGPAGDPNPSGGMDLWADGISLGCGNSTVAGNLVFDATDGGIVIFGAPGSQIYNNEIDANNVTLLGGINMVDWAPMSGSFTGTKVWGNTINGKGAYIKAGIAMGNWDWFCPGGNLYADINHRVYGAEVYSNTVTGAHVGYGYAVNNVDFWSVHDNVDHARHVGQISQSRLCGNPSQPAAFQSQWDWTVPNWFCGTQSDPFTSQFQNPPACHVYLQSGFQSASLEVVTDVTEPRQLRPNPPSGCGALQVNEGLMPGGSVDSCGGAYRLTLQYDGNLVLYRTSDWAAIWATHTNGLPIASAILGDDGNFVLYDNSGAAKWSVNSRPAGANAHLWIQNWDSNLVLYDQNTHAVWWRAMQP